MEENAKGKVKGLPFFFEKKKGSEKETFAAKGQRAAFRFSIPGPEPWFRQKAKGRQAFRSKSLSFASFLSSERKEGP